ncbi:hypothetical protein GE09DRAFT_1022155 [Coniochaeta sp. 2T2.1]|nr:hypothetical protein GE09DRAFT_1022155 [Coniochaeta sp. 2T2.1]
MSSKRKANDSGISAADQAPLRGREGSDSGEPRAPGSGPSAVKRQRVSRACDQCRAAREKCDGIQPLCFPCVSQNRPCTYQANPKKRGVQTGYIRTLELALAWTFEKVPGSEDALSSLLTHAGGQGRRLLTGSGSESAAANRLHQRWRRSRVHKDIDRILSGGGQDDKSPSFDDATDTEADVDRLPGQSPIPATGSAYGFAQPAEGHHDKRSQEGPVSSFSPYSAVVPAPPAGLKLPSNHWRLMDIYFSYTHCWLPILEKQEMFQASYLYSPEHGLDLSLDSQSAGTHAELWSALTLAAYQDGASSGPSSGSQSDGSVSMTPDQIYNIARNMIPGDDGIFQIHHTRALILLGLVNLGRKNLATAWLLVGRAVRIFLDVSARDEFRHEKPKQRLHSLFIACFIMDTMVSQQYQKPPHLTADDMVQAVNISENDLDEWQPWAACEGFGQNNDNSRVSRSPAFSSSTFNQLYDIFKVISRNIAARRARTGHDPDSSIGRPHLQQAINPQARFGSYILSTDADSASIPSPYLLKMFYLWAMGLVDTISPSTARLLLSVIEQFHCRFGTCAMPPCVVACLLSWTSLPDFNGLEQQDKIRFNAILHGQASIWALEPGAPSLSVEHPNPENTPLPFKDVHQVGRHRGTMSPPAGPSAAIPRPPPSFAPAVLPIESLSPSQVRPDLNSPYVFPSYGNPPGLLSPAVTVMARDTTRDAVHDMENAAAAQAAANLQSQYLITSQPGLSVSTDYDALLDDLASMDYADRVETDPQFMVNLGFAPGCDLNEVLSLDFARY